jgi:AcrR family transcriptional regulator
VNGSSPTRVMEAQRARILTATVRVVGEHGYRGMSVARVCSRAGVSRRTFYDLFDDREDCFLEVFEETVARFATTAHIAAREETSWRGKTRAGLAALLIFAGEEPALAKLVVNDVLGSGPRVFARRTRVVKSLSVFVEEARAEAKTGDGPPPLMAEGTVGAVLAIVHMRLFEPNPRPLVELLNPLMSMIVLPFLGRAAATKELSRPLPNIPRPHRKPSAGAPVLDGLEMRVTNRTLMVLSAIATDPGASNRQIADSAGIHDQGQISKLLARLERLRLIHNTGLGHAKGEANAWNLTPTGQQLQHTTKTQPWHTANQED